jgi:LPS-assembly protein
MRLRLTPRDVALAAAFASLPVAAQSTPAGSATEQALPPMLKPAPQLTPPPLGSPHPPGTAAPATGARPPFQEGTIFLRADHVNGVAEKYVEATGKVELRTRTETVLADSLRYDFVADEVFARGNVLIRHGIDWITGPEVKFKRDTETGYFMSPRFYIGENGSRGSASEIRFKGPNRYEASDARYTTCVAPRDDWYIRMDELEVDRSRQVGTGHDATLYFLGAPVMYTPWAEFPLSNERKSGFLTPVLGSSQTRGFEYAQPYYFNLAPNYDATIAPRLMTKRGLQVAGQGRYLFDDSQGEATGEYLANDRVTGTTRWGVSWKHAQRLDSLLPGLGGYWNYNKVSDNTYFADLADRVGLTSQTTLPREIGLVYGKAPWSVIARAQEFQTLLDPSLPPGPPPYNRVPQLLGALQNVDWKGFTFSGTGEYANFQNPTLVTGQRAYAYPIVAWTKQGPAWYFTATQGVHARHYSLNSATPDVAEQNYVIPISTLDAGLVFERDWSAFGHNFVQTLEPRAYYVYVPFRDQSKAPVFDTAIDDFNFAQLYSPNRYLGNDRIGDANQITVGLTSRLLDPTTAGERLRVEVGERFYFQSQRVILSEAARSATSSDFLVGAEGRLSEVWALSGLMEYNFSSGDLERLDAGFRYTPAPGKAFNASYRYARQEVSQVGIPTELKQFDLSAQWPISETLSLLGRWNYSLVDNRTLEAIGGLEYNGGCYVVRLVGQRLQTTTQQYTTAIYLQVELNGLARFGTNPLDLLRRSVPGYQRTNDPTLSPKERDDQFQEY